MYFLTAPPLKPRVSPPPHSRFPHQRGGEDVSLQLAAEPVDHVIFICVTPEHLTPIGKPSVVYVEDVMLRGEHVRGE